MITKNLLSEKVSRHQQSKSQQLSAYTIAVGSVAAATTIKLLFEATLGTTSPYLLYLAAVMVSAFYGGFRPGFVATILGAALAHLIFSQPTYTIFKPDWRQNIPPVAFLMEGGLICYFTESLRRARRESELVGNEFRLLVDGTLKHCLVLLDPSGRIKSWNHGARRVFAYTSGEIVDQHYSRFFAMEEGIETSQDLIGTAAQLGRLEVEGWRVRKDGSQFRAVMALTALRNTRGQVSGFVLVTFDVSDRWQAERALLENERQLRLMADSLPVLIAYIDSECRYQFNNATHERWFGIAPDLFRGRHIGEVLEGGVLQLSQDRIDKVLRGEPQTYEAQIPLSACEARHVHVDCIPHQTSDGRIPGFYVLIADVTEQKSVESALRAGEERLRSIVNTAVDAIITLDRRGTIESVNVAAERMFGHSSAEMVGQNVGLFLPVPDLLGVNRNAGESARSTMRRMISSGREVHALRKDGSTFPIEITVSEVGSFGLFTGILRDVTQRMELEREVLEATATEQRRIGQEMHDHVGQELTGLELLVDALLESVLSSREIGVDLVRKIATGLRQAHKDVRMLARGLLPVEIHPNGLQDALASLTRQIGDRDNLRCGFKARGIVQVCNAATATHMFRIAQEAISNSIRHANAARIDVALRVEGNMLILEIVDDGCGIEDSPHRGTGMGLRLMEYRASLIGGILTVESAEMKGTKVTCRVPHSKHHPVLSQ